jgi:two-component system chemotaxis response regulator CheY
MKQCLIVDHSPALRTIARRILEELQYAVGEAEDGLSALTACRAAMPDLIFLDWNLPHMMGVEFVKALRGLANGDHPRILFCTTENNRREIASAIAAGANECILKPFDRGQVRTKLAAIGLAA